MAPQIIRLPDGQDFHVTPVFSGLFFKSNQRTTHPNAFPIGWTVVLNTQDEEHIRTDDKHCRDEQSGGGVDECGTGACNDAGGELSQEYHRLRIHSYTKPTLKNDNLFISSVSIPPSSEYKTPASPTRQIAMMLWITLYWYFHQQEPPSHLTTEASKNTPDEAKPRGEWRINIKKDGVFRGRNLIPKLERMGLIASLDSSPDDDWESMFVSKKMFWQIPGRLFLFSLEPNNLVGSVPGSPINSRPGSPQSQPLSPSLLPHQQLQALGQPQDSYSNQVAASTPTTTAASSSALHTGPFHSTSHLPTYYPPAPLSYTTTNNIRHPRRPKPPQAGEVFYTRFIPSTGQYLSFRVASTSPDPIPYGGPVGHSPPVHPHLHSLSDTALLQSWFSQPRVSKFWGDFKEEFLPTAAKSRHSFPVIGLWDGVPFGYFEIYWVKEDILGEKMGGEAGDWDRGLHVLIGEEWARGLVPTWLSSLVHWSLVADYRTMNVYLEPRVDNDRFLKHLQKEGFSRERQIAFPHKQSWLIRMRRESWEGPAL